MRKDKPSKTAADIAKYLVYLAEETPYAALLPEGVAELNTRLCYAWFPRFQREHRWMKRGSWQLLVRLAERMFMPGLSLHHALRKRFMDETIRQAVADGARQLVVLGAGFDTLALRVAADNREVTCIEVDHPATQRVKRRGVEQLGVGGPNHHFVPLDLTRTTLDETLTGCDAFRAGERSVFLAEGLLMYLRPEDVDRVFAVARELTAPGSRFAFTHLRVDERGRPTIGRMDWAVRLKLRAIGEPFYWGLALDGRESFLEPRGFRLVDAVGPPEHRARTLEPLGLGAERIADFEWFAVAESRGSVGEPC